MNWLSSEAVERIVKAAGLEPLQISDRDPPRFAKHDFLQKSLRKSIEHYHGAIERRTDKIKQARIRRLRRILKTLDRLEDLLAPEGDWEWTQNSDHEWIVSEIPYLRDRTNRELWDIEHRLRWGDDADVIGLGASRKLTDDLRKRSPFDWLVGVYLPETYRENFGKEPTLRRRPSDNQLYGPYIQFVEQVLIEFQITSNGRQYGREAIAKALQNAKHGLTRRRATPRR